MSKPVKGDDGIDAKVIEALQVIEAKLAKMDFSDAIKIVAKVAADPAFIRNLSRPVVLEMIKVSALMAASSDENIKRIGMVAGEVASKYNEVREKQSAGGRKGNELRAKRGNTARRASASEL